MNPLVKYYNFKKKSFGPLGSFVGGEILDVSGNPQNRPRMSEPISMELLSSKTCFEAIMTQGVCECATKVLKQRVGSAKEC